MTEYATDSPEFIDAVVALPDRFAGRLADSDLQWLRDTSQAGEWGEALESLVAGLAQRGSTVTPDERSELRRLLKTAGLDEAAVDNLTVNG